MSRESTSEQGNPVEAPRRQVTMIAAYAHGRVIGDGPDIPWHSSEDFGHFKAMTLGHALVMGRVTHESIGRPLPGRRTIVLTRDPQWRADGVKVARTLEEAYALAGDEQIFVAGGAQVYEAALPSATHQILTEIDVDVPGDARYPEFDTQEWAEVRRISRRELSPPLEWVWWERR